MPEGLMHVGAMAVILGTGYLGLEKLNSTRNSVVESIEALTIEIKDKIASLEINYVVTLGSGKKSIHSCFNNVHGHFLLSVAGFDCKDYTAGNNTLYGAYSAWHAPGLRYFRYGYHGIPVWTLTVLSILSFFLLVALDIYYAQSGILGSVLYERVLDGWAWLFLFIFALTIFFVFVNAFLAHRISKLPPLCQGLLDQLTEQLRADEQEMKRVQRAKLEDAYVHSDTNREPEA